MNKKANVIGLALIAALASSGTLAQMGSAPLGQMPGASPPMPVAVSPRGAPLVVSPLGAAVANPTAAPRATPGVMPVAGASVPSGNPGVDPNAEQTNVLRDISTKKAQLELLRVQSEIEKLIKPQQDAAKKDESVSLQKALEAAQKENSSKAAVAVAGPAVDPGPPVLLLATFGSPDNASSSYAELKVGDMIVYAKVGDRLSSGDYVKAINFDSIELSKVKKPTLAKRNKLVYINSGDTAAAYSSRGRSGAVTEGGSASSASSAPSASVSSTQPMSPGSLPPMPMAR